MTDLKPILEITEDVLGNLNEVNKRLFKMMEKEKDMDKNAQLIIVIELLGYSRGLLIGLSECSKKLKGIENG